MDNEEQLAIYDMLYSDKLSKDEIKAIKEMSKELYAKIHELMEEMNNWAQKENTKAKIQKEIYDIIYFRAPDVIYDNCQEYQDNIFEYYFTRYGAAA